MPSIKPRHGLGLRGAPSSLSKLSKLIRVAWASRSPPLRQVYRCFDVMNCSVHCFPFSNRLAKYFMSKDPLAEATCLSVLRLTHVYGIIKTKIYYNMYMFYKLIRVEAMLLVYWHGSAQPPSRTSSLLNLQVPVLRFVFASSQPTGQQALGLYILDTIMKSTQRAAQNLQPSNSSAALSFSSSTSNMISIRQFVGVIAAQKHYAVPPSSTRCYLLALGPCLFLKLCAHRAEDCHTI